MGWLYLRQGASCMGNTYVGIPESSGVRRGRQVDQATYRIAFTARRRVPKRDPERLYCTTWRFGYLSMRLSSRTRGSQLRRYRTHEAVSPSRGCGSEEKITHYIVLSKGNHITQYVQVNIRKLVSFQSFTTKKKWQSITGSNNGGRYIAIYRRKIFIVYIKISRNPTKSFPFDSKHQIFLCSMWC